MWWCKCSGKQIPSFNVLCLLAITQRALPNEIASSKLYKCWKTELKATATKDNVRNVYADDFTNAVNLFGALPIKEARRLLDLAASVLRRRHQLPEDDLSLSDENGSETELANVLPSPPDHDEGDDEVVMEFASALPPPAGHDERREADELDSETPAILPQAKASGCAHALFNWISDWAATRLASMKMKAKRPGNLSQRTAVDTAGQAPSSTSTPVSHPPGYATSQPQMQPGGLPARPPGLPARPPAQRYIPQPQQVMTEGPFPTQQAPDPATQPLRETWQVPTMPALPRH